MKFRLEEKHQHLQYLDSLEQEEAHLGKSTLFFPINL